MNARNTTNKNKRHGKKFFCHGFGIITLILTILISITLFLGLTVKKYMVDIEDQGEHSLIFTDMVNSEDILQQANIDVSEHDRVVLSAFDENNTANLKIERSFSIFVTSGGNTHSVNVIDETVADVLEMLEIKYDKDDIVTPALDKIVAVGQDIEVVKVDTKIVKRKEKVKFKTETTYTPSMPDGKKNVTQYGADGVKEIRTLHTYHDGVVVDKDVVSEKVTKKPVKQEVIEGKSGSTASRLDPPKGFKLDQNGDPIGYKKKYTGKATAYSSLGKPTKLVPGMIAMNLNDFPRGTKLYVKSADGSYIYGYSEVRDTGTALYDGRTFVDLFFNSYAESVHFGAKTVEVFVLE